MELKGEVVLTWPSPPARPKPIRAVRSTLVTSGRALLQARGLFDRYTRAIGEERSRQVQGIVAGTWLDVEFMHAHYAAWDSLDLSAAEVRAIGRTIGSGVRDTMQLALKHLATGIGATPWTALNQYPRFWPRAFDGGGFCITRLGPKESSLLFTEIPFARSAYFRGSLLAIHEDALALFATKMYTRIVPSSLTPTSFEVRLSWV